MCALRVSRIFLGIKCILVNTFSCLDILYMYIHFRPVIVTVKDRNYLKKPTIKQQNRKDLIDRVSLGGKLYAN